MLQLIQSMGVQIHYKSLESGKSKYEQRLKFLGVNVLDDKIEDILPPGGCRYHAVIVAHRDPFFEVIQALISSRCLEVTVFDTGANYSIEGIFYILFKHYYYCWECLFLFLYS